MARLLLVVCCALCAVFCFSSQLQAQGLLDGRTKQGYGLMITNDVVDGGRDRWRTGSFESSLILARGWQGKAPARFGELLELRINGEVVSPEFANNPSPNDRRYGQALSFGLHTHWQPSRFDYALGLDAVITGPDVGLDDVQVELHEVLGGANPSPAVLAAQISSGVHANAVFEAGYRAQFGAATEFRPFVEARAGTETLARVGFDLTVGGYGSSGLLVRNPISGHRLSAVEDAPYSGFSWVVGADMAYVDNSVFLPSSGPVRLENIRSRVRTGVHWRTRAGTSVYYGVTWLSKEFNTQRSGQFVGSLQLRVKF